jgi:hypothetical protein
MFPPVILGLIGLSWATLFLWEASPYGRYLDHCRCCSIQAAGC